jgi:hypothetical protein
VAGIDSSFSWKSIAAGVVTSAIGAAIAPSIGSVIDSDLGRDIANGVIGGVVGANARKAFGLGGDIDYGRILADAFGNALGSAAVKGIQHYSELKSMTPQQRASYEGMLKSGIPVADALRYAKQASGPLPSYLKRRFDPDAEQRERSRPLMAEAEDKVAEVLDAIEHGRPKKIMDATAEREILNDAGLKPNRTSMTGQPLTPYQNNVLTHVGHLRDPRFGYLYAEGLVGPSASEDYRSYRDRYFAFDAAVQARLEVHSHTQLVDAVPHVEENYVELQPVEDLYTPFYGVLEYSYNEYTAGYTNPDNSWGVRALGFVGAVGTAVPAMAEMMVSGILNAPNMAGRAGQHAARANIYYDRGDIHEGNIEVLQAVQNGATAFASAGDAVTLGQAGLASRTARSGMRPPVAQASAERVAANSGPEIASISTRERIATASSGQLAELMPVSSLSKRQAAIHSALSEQGAFSMFPKRGVSMSDLRAIGRVTGDEYNMFTNGGRRLIIRGEGNAVEVSLGMYDDLLNGVYGRWSGHTHPPGYSLIPGPADRPFLSQMNQRASGIWGDEGHYVFGRNGLVDDAVIQSEAARKALLRLYGEQ